MTDDTQANTPSESQSPQKERVIIIGGGPAGLAAAMYNARAYLNPLVIEGSPSGGQLMLTTDVENYPGFTAIQGPDLVKKFRDHAEHFGTRFVADNVKSADFSNPDDLKIELSSGQIMTTESVLIATGASARWLDIESETRLRGKGVSACATCDGFFFKDQVVAVVGGGDTAMEEALVMTRFASKVYVIHRRDAFRASQIMQKRVFEHEKIEVLWGTEVEEILGDQRVEGVRLKFSTDTSKNNPAIENGVLKAGGVFIAIGHIPNTAFLKDTGLLMRPNGYLITSYIYAWEKHRQPDFSVPSEGLDFHYQHATNKKGVFAAGDVVDHIYRQASTAAGLAVAASLEIEKYLEDKKG